MKKKLIVFASGNGSNFINIYNKIKSNHINGKICLLVSNNPNCNAVKFCMNNDIDFFIYNTKKFPSDNNQMSLIKKIKKYNPDLIVLAGYMKKISHRMIDLFKYKILNIHPSLLPDYGGEGYYGMKVHESISENGETQTGATVHFVDKDYDTGPIFFQKKIQIKAGENPNVIAKKVLEIEHKIYFESVKLFCEDKIYWEDNKPLIRG